MSVDEATAETAIDAPRLRGLRVRAGLRQPSNWLQLVRFGVVGASGVVVNLAVFAVCVHGASLDYKVAATVAFVIALGNNFVWNRLWTFRGSDVHVGFQAARFCVVSCAAFVFNLVVLYTLVDGFGMPAVPAQALAIASATPLNFIGNKLWSFKA